MIKVYITPEQKELIEVFKRNQFLKDQYSNKLYASNYMFKLDMNKSIDLTKLSIDEVYLFVLAMKDQIIVKNLEFKTENSDIQYNHSKQRYEVSKFFGKKKNEKVGMYVNISDIDEYMLDIIANTKKKFKGYEHMAIFFDNSDNTIYHYFLTEEDEEERIYELI